MILGDDLEAMIACVEGDPHGRKALQRLLDRLVHDLNNPLGALSLECFNLRLALEQVRRSSEERDDASVRRQLREAEHVLAAIEGARAKAATTVAMLDRPALPQEPEGHR